MGDRATTSSVLGVVKRSGLPLGKGRGRLKDRKGGVTVSQINPGRIGVFGTAEDALTLVPLFLREGYLVYTPPTKRILREGDSVAPHDVRGGAIVVAKDPKKVGNLKVAKAAVTPLRQRTQYSCMSASMAMCLRANGVETDEDTVNEVMGARPMRGAAWEDAMACAQHYGMKCVFMCPASVTQLKRWTDMGYPVMIAWNPEGRPWAHASVVYDVAPDESIIFVADPNIPDPEQTVREVPKEDFYRKWAETHARGYLIRRPAMAILPEITQDGRQMWASETPRPSCYKVAAKYSR